MIKTLGTNNFKKVGTKEFLFLPGLNVLRGPNWSGKSSTIGAMKFALQSSAGVAGSKDDIPTWDSTGKMNVTMHFGDIKIVRSLKDCNIYKGDKVEATGHTACNKYLDDMFGISVQHYNMLHFSDQGETAGLLTIGATAIQAVVEKISNVDLIDKVLKKTTADLSEMKGKLEGAEIVDTKELKESIQQFEEQKLTLEDELAKLTSEQGFHADIVAKAKGKVETTKLLLRQAEANREKLTDLNTKISNAEAILKSIDERDLVEPESTDKLSEDISGIGKEIDSLRSQIDGGQSVLDRYTVVKDWMDNHSDTALATEEYYLEEKESLEAVLEIAKENKVRAHTELGISRAALKTAEENVNSTFCSKCERVFEDHASHLEENKREVEKLILEEVEYSDAHDAFTNEISETTQLLSELVVPATLDVKAKILGFNAELENLSETLVTEAELSDLSGQLEDHETELVTLNVSLSTSKEIKQRYDRVIKLFTTNTDIVKNCNSEKLELTESEDEDLLRSELDTANEDLTTEREYDTHLTNQIENLNDFKLPGLIKDLTTAMNSEAEATKSNESIKKLRKKQSGVKRLAKYLRESRSRFLTGIWNSVLGYATTFCKTCTQDEIEGIVRDDKGNFKFIENGAERPVAVASGAQRAFLGIGVRLGLARALYGSSSFMVLDEPSADMSGENTTRLVSTLMASGLQIIYSTHSDMEELAAGHVIDLGEM